MIQKADFSGIRSPFAEGVSHPRSCAILARGSSGVISELSLVAGLKHRFLLPGKVSPRPLLLPEKSLRRDAQFTKLPQKKEK